MGVDVNISLMPAFLRESNLLEGRDHISSYVLPLSLVQRLETNDQRGKVTCLRPHSVDTADPGLGQV